MHCIVWSSFFKKQCSYFGSFNRHISCYWLLISVYLGFVFIAIFFKKNTDSFCSCNHKVLCIFIVSAAPILPHKEWIRACCYKCQRTHLWFAIPGKLPLCRWAIEKSYKQIKTVVGVVSHLNQLRSFPALIRMWLLLVVWRVQNPRRGTPEY